MNKTKVIETKIETPFGVLRQKSTYTPTPIQVSGGIYLSDRESAKNDLVIEELFALYISGQTYGNIIVDGREISFDILFEFKDSEGQIILPQDMNVPLLYNIIYNEVMGLGCNDFNTFEVKIEYFLDERAILDKQEDKEKSEYVTGVDNCKMRKDNVCAFCTLHDCYLSVKQMKQRACLNKNCRHLQKEEHDFWINQGQKYLSKTE